MNIPLLINDFLRRAAKLYPHKVAVVDGALRQTYGQLRDRVNQLAHALQALGVQKGDRVCILSPNSRYFLEAFYGVSQLGAILVPLNYRLQPEEHEYIINHAGVTVVLADHEQVRAIAPIRARLAQVQRYVSAGGDAVEPGWLDWDALCAAAPTTATEPVAVAEDDVFSINYTSGTTARPKGVMLTHRNCYLNALNLIIFAGLQHEDVELWTLPHFHANGWGGVFAITALGGTHVILRAVVARDIFRLMAKERVTFGRPIHEHQAISFKLAEMEARTAAARELTYRASAAADRDEPGLAKLTSMAKLVASDTAMWVTTEAVQVLGGYGYVSEYPVERMMRDAKITQIYEGTNEIQRLVISRAMR